MGNTFKPPRSILYMYRGASFAIKGCKHVRPFNHYDYIDVVLPEMIILLRKVHPDINLYGVCPVSHGDKVYQYKSGFEKARIPFYRGALLYLLSYSSLLDRPRHEVVEWVVEQYPFFKSFFEAAEDALF